MKTDPNLLDRSIFRKNIGRAVLNKHEDDYLEGWEGVSNNSLVEPPDKYL